MVDWGAGHTDVGHATSLQEVAKDSGYFSITEMFQDETELNAMDFVETEYKSEKYKDDKSTLRKSISFSTKRSRQRKVNGPRDSDETEAARVKGYTDIDAALLAKERTVKNKIKRKQKRVQKPLILPLEPCTSAETIFRYPYANILKSLCEQVGKVQNQASDSFSSKIFDQLRHTDVHYPYASLLEELHQNAEVKETDKPSLGESFDSEESSELGVADVMRNLHYPTTSVRSFDGTEAIRSEDFETPYTTMLLAAVLKKKILEYTCTQYDEKKKRTGQVRGIGKILKTHMPESLDSDPAPSELQSSALLRKLSFSVQQDEVKEMSSQEEQVIVWSTSESASASSESDDCEWRPTCQRAKQITRGKRVPRKRKTKRKKKKNAVRNKSFTDFDSSHSLQGHFTNPRQMKPRTKRKLEPEMFKSSPSTVTRSELPEHCLGENLNDSEDSVVEESQETFQVERARSRRMYRHVGSRGRKRSKRRNCQNNNTRNDSCTRRGRLRKTSYNPLNEKLLKLQENMSDESWHTSGIDHLGSVESSSNPLGNLQQHMARAGEPQSLLKEYLLKPAGEEMTSTKNCDIPKVETNFLFSRLLQNFKSLAETTQSDSNPSRAQESCSGSSILRGMLASGNSSSDLLASNSGEQETRDNKSFIERMNALSSIPQYSPENSVFDTNNTVCRVKCEQEIKVECEDEVVCKVECEEDSFECQVCHLQFSSGVDLSNHQILFHCSEDGQTSGPHTTTLLPCSVDNLQSSVMQEKLPA